MLIDLHNTYDKVHVTSTTRAVRKLHKGTTTSQAKLDNRLTRKINVNKSLRQGCCISPAIFKIYVAKALKESEVE